MTKKEFLDRLAEALKGQMPPAEAEENLRYYREYMAGEMARGKTEEQVLDELGDPRLIARSILSAAGSRGWEEAGSPEGRKASKGKKSQGGSWKWVLLLLAVLLLALLAVTRVIFVIFRLFLTPAFWVLIALAFGAGYFFRRR